MDTSAALYRRLEELAAAGQLTAARRLAEREVESSLLDDRRFWLLHLGYACFLDHDDFMHDEAALSAFRRAKELPGDAWPAFWLAYTRIIYRAGTEADYDAVSDAGVGEVRPYCDLVLGRRLYGLGEFEDALQRFEAVLAVIPNFWGALYETIRSSARIGNLQRGRSAASAILEGMPYRERGQGVMNAYMNDVFTMHDLAVRVVKEASAFMKAPKRYKPGIR